MDQPFVDTFDHEVRLAAFQFLDEQTLRHGEVLPWDLLKRGFSHHGTEIQLIGASGIWKPAALELPISITTAPPKANRPAPYEDVVRDDGLLVYRYQGTDPRNHFNVGLRRLFELQRPLIYLYGVDKGRYQPFWPSIIVEDHPGDLHVAVALYEGAAAGTELGTGPAGEAGRSYARRLTLRRLHQAAFRERVLRAYRQTCAVCRLHHVELLDAAHILPDSDPRGVPVVPNGLALCKIHHAAFDRHIMGVRPDYVIEIRSDVLGEEDGPMLRHGLQGVHNAKILLPRRQPDHPNPDFLEERYEQFRRAG